MRQGDRKGTPCRTNLRVERSIALTAPGRGPAPPLLYTGLVG